MATGNKGALDGTRQSRTTARGPAAEPAATIAGASGPLTLNAACYSVFSVTMAGNIAPVLIGAVPGIASTITLYLYQGSAGGCTVTWPASVSWIGGTAPSLNTAAGALNVLVFESLAGDSAWYGSLVQELPPLPLSIANGGSGQNTQSAAITALAGSQTTGYYLRSDGSNTYLQAIEGADVPTLNQNTSGNAATATNLAGGATFPDYVAPAVASLTYGTAIAVNAALGNAFNLTASGTNGTVSTVTNSVDGQVIRFRITQGTGGSKTVAWGTAFDFGTGAAPTLSTTAAKVDIVAFEYVGSISKWACLGSGLGY